MKRNLIIFVLILLCIFFTSCTTGIKVNRYDTLKITIDNLEYACDAKLYYYDNAKEVKKLNNHLFDKYDSSYFKDDSLIIVTLKESENNHFNISNIINGTLPVYKDILLDDNYVNWTFILEIENKVKDTNINVSFLDRSKHSHAYSKHEYNPTCLSEGYTLYECYECGDNYIDDYKSIVSCFYENGICIWCNSAKIKNIGDKIYTGIEIATTNKRIEDFYHIPFEIKDGKLYSMDDCFNEGVLINLENKLFDYTKLNILKGYEDIVSKISLVKKVYYFGGTVASNKIREIYIVPCEDNLYFIKKNIDLETDEIVELSIKHLNNDIVMLWFIGEDGSCLVDENYKFVRRNNEYTIDFTDYMFFTDTFINMDALVVYDKIIYANTHMKLVPYDRQEGIFYMYIIDYLLKYGNFHFTSQYVTEDELLKHQNIIYDENKIILVIDDIKYTLHKEFSYYLIRDIEMSSSIFKTYEEDERILSILFGLNNLDYNLPNISVTKIDSRYLVKLGHPPITG